MFQHLRKDAQVIRWFKWREKQAVRFLGSSVTKQCTAINFDNAPWMFNQNCVLDNISYPDIVRKVPLSSWRETDWQYLLVGQPMKNIPSFHVSVNDIKVGVKLYYVWSVCHLKPTLPLRQESGPSNVQVSIWKFNQENSYSMDTQLC